MAAFGTKNTVAYVSSRRHYDTCLPAGSSEGDSAVMRPTVGNIMQELGRTQGTRNRENALSREIQQLFHQMGRDGVPLDKISNLMSRISYLKG